AGLVPGLPAAVKAHLPNLPVISVPLTSGDMDAREILLGSLSLPARRPVLITGINRSGLRKAAHVACEIFGAVDRNFKQAYESYVRASTPSPDYDVSIEDSSTPTLPRVNGKSSAHSSKEA